MIAAIADIHPVFRKINDSWQRFKNDKGANSGMGSGFDANIGTHGKGSMDYSVYIIGAGVGDPELLTLKAHRLIASADIILVDWLVSKDIYQFFPKKAEVLFVGKRCGKHSMKQDEICELLLAKAKTGRRVVRLKGGDPSIFGRLAEETEILNKHNIPVAVIPGITAASGCAAYAGIPLTHRDCAQGVKFVTASLKSDDLSCDWQALAQEKDTLVFYMGLSRIVQIAERLQHHGMRSDMPMAIIDQGTLAEQKVVCATLATAEQVFSAHEFQGPALIVVGEVVNKRHQVADSLLFSQNTSA